MSATEAVPVVAETEAPSSNGRPAPAPAAPKPAKAPKAKAPKAKAKPVGRTTRVVLRHLDPWSVLKLSLVYYLAVFVVILVAGMILWAGASAVGVVGNIESFMEDIGFEDFRFIPSDILRGTALGGLVLVIAGTCGNVLLATLFNLMSDVVGGLKLTLQEDVPRTTSDEGRSTV